MFSVVPKTTISHKKVPSKLSLKKNIRRSSILDKKAIPLKNDSLIDKSTISLFSSSDSDVFEVSLEDKQNNAQSSTVKPNNLSFKFSNLHYEEEKYLINSTKNESDIFISSTINEKPSLILINATSVIDNSTNSLFSSFGGNTLEICEDDKQSKSSAYQDSDSLKGILINDNKVKDNLYIASFEKEKNSVNSERKEDINTTVTVASPPISDLLEGSYEQPDRNQHIEMLDKLYGKEWRKAEKLVFSEPRPARPLKTKVNAPKTDIKPFKSVTNIFPKKKKIASKPLFIKNVQNVYDSDTSDGNSEENIKTVRTKLFPKVVRKPVKSPWIQRLQNLCDSDTSEEESEKENRNVYVSNKIKRKLNYSSSSAITSDNSDYDSSFVTTDESCKSDDASDTYKKKVKSKPIKKSEEYEKSDKEKGVDNKKFELCTPGGDKKGKLTSAIKYVPSLNSSEIIQKSFLESLSAFVPLDQCHPTARIFRNSYQTYKVQLTERLFKLFNEKIFNNLIPDDTAIVWNVNLTKTAGYCKYKRIKAPGKIEKKLEISLSVKVLDSAERLRCTLVHEMIHGVCMISGTHDSHGPNFKAWARKANGIFPELPPITRCHNYHIKAKYTYKCLSCGYCINRHSKSIDLTKKVCGRCRGKFELLLNKTAKGEKKSVPVTPKTPSGFALFVKNNYAQCRTPELKHAEVMKLLGSKFNELKLSVGK